MHTQTRRVSLRSAERLVFYALLAAAIGMTLFQRSFPSQDGPLHLYYIDVLHDLLRNSGLYYGAVFAIKHLVPPYAFHAYVLLALNTLFDPLVSEKILVAGYIVWFAFGFRYLVHSIDPENDWAPLLALPLGLNRTLFMGFYNFSFGVATTLWVAGYWLRYHDRLTLKRSFVFLGLVALLAFMHPVALVLAVMFLGLHTAVLLLLRLSQHGFRRTLAGSRALIVNALLATTPLLWIAAYTDSHKLSLVPPVWFRIATFAGSTTIAPLRPWSYRGPLAALSVAVLVLAGLRLLKYEWRKPADIALPLSGLACLAIYVVAPPAINYNACVPERFPIFGILFFAAFAAGWRLRPWLERGAVVGVTVIAVVLLSWQAVAKQRVINDLRPLYDGPVKAAGLRTAVVADAPIPSKGFYPYNYMPYVWAGATYLRRAKLHFMNYAWLRSPVMLLAPRQPSACGFEDPYPMLECLQVSGAASWGRPDMMISVERKPVLVAQLARELKMKPEPTASAWLHVYTR